MLRPPITWKGLIYYGEVFGFALAWLVVFAVATHESDQQAASPNLDQVASIDPIGAFNSTPSTPRSIR